MRYVEVGIGILILGVLASIFMPIYMGNALAANVTGWSTTMVSLQNNAIPLVLLASILVIIVIAAFIRRGSRA